MLTPLLPKVAVRVEDTGAQEGLHLDTEHIPLFITKEICSENSLQSKLASAKLAL